MTNSRFSAILNNRKGAAGKRLALKNLVTQKEVTAWVGAEGGYFFLLAAIKRPMMPMITSEYWNSSLYVTIGQPPFRKIREQEAAPRARGPTACRYKQR